MLVKSRGQSSVGQLLVASASAAQPSASEEGVRGVALPLVPSVNQTQIMNMLFCQSPSSGEGAVTSSPAAKILQSKSRSAILLKLDGKYVVVVVSSGMCHLQLVERYKRPLLVSCADCHDLGDPSVRPFQTPLADEHDRRRCRKLSVRKHVRKPNG